MVVSPEAGRWTTPSPLATAVSRMTEAFANTGAKVLTCSPFYKSQLSDVQDYQCIYTGVERLMGKTFEVWKSPKDPLNTYIYNEEYFGRPEIYGPPHDVPYGDNHLRFAFLSSASLAYTIAINMNCTAILAHEWGGALVGALAHNTYRDEFGMIPFFFAIHNITYDFHVQSGEIEAIGLPREDYNMDGYEFWGKVSLLKAGICYSHKVLFPSPGYRDAMLNTNLAGGLSGFLNHNAEKLIGVQFGVSYQTWDFNQNKLPIREAKLNARHDLEKQLETQFNGNLVLYVHLDEESGNTSETLATILSEITKLRVFLIVGISPEHPEWAYYQDVSNQYPSTMRLQPLEGMGLKNIEILRNTLAGSDMLFAANLNEPSCSIILKAMAAGTVPLTGRNVGIASLLTDHNEEKAPYANAFLVDDANAPHQILRRIKDTMSVYHDQSDMWNKVVHNAYDGFHYEWDKTVSKYLLILGELSL